jgi:5'-deoxynucleotidase YfbR-like HD superfamily hydrolase
MIRPDILIQSGNYFNFVEPEKNVYTIEDIAHALSNICRFGGHSARFYSVAQHSVYVAWIVAETRPDLALHALLHDATEAFLGDITKPLKQLLPDYMKLESRTERAIFERFGLPPELPAEVKHADMVMLATEQRDLMPAHDDVWERIIGIEPLRDKLFPWANQTSKGAFLREFRRLTSKQEREDAQST